MDVHFDDYEENTGELYSSVLSRSRLYLKLEVIKQTESLMDLHTKLQQGASPVMLTVVPGDRHRSPATGELFPTAVVRSIDLSFLCFFRSR